MDDIELQQDVERYASQLTERVTQALEPLERSPNTAISDSALKHNLLCASAAVDIASGPFPDVNLLDMLVFVRLSREVVEEYWVPGVYGTGGEDLQHPIASPRRSCGPSPTRSWTSHGNAT
jgi:hypothetical protein